MGKGGNTSECPVPLPGWIIIVLHRPVPSLVPPLYPSVYPPPSFSSIRKGSKDEVRRIPRRNRYVLSSLPSSMAVGAAAAPTAAASSSSSLVSSAAWFRKCFTSLSCMLYQSMLPGQCGYWPRSSTCDARSPYPLPPPPKHDTMPYHDIQ